MPWLAAIFDPFTVRALLALVVVVDLLALVAIAASRSHAPKVKAIWAAIVLILPLFGAIAWLALGRAARGRHG